MNKPITLCDKCDIYMNCLLDYDGVACRRNRTVKPTNADFIRAMSDEELARFLTHQQILVLEAVCKQFGIPFESLDMNVKKAEQEWLDKLRHEVIDGNISKNGL